MTHAATTTISTWRGEGEPDEFGDPTDAPMTPGTEHKTGMPVGLIEKDRRDWNAQTQEARTVRVASLRVNPVDDIAPGDRIKDERTGRTWIIDGTTTAPAISGLTSVVFALRATSAP